jgi:hypothetical protein
MQEIFDWITNIIDSCSEDFHFSAVDALIKLFASKFGEGELYDDLTLKREIRWNQINGIIPPNLQK